MTIANLGELRGAVEDILARADFPSLFPVASGYSRASSILLSG